MSYSFVARDSCPACGGKAVDCAFRRGFNEEPVRGFIRDYYRVDPAMLEDGDYELVRCRSCTLLYQKWVGDYALLSELYGVWIETDRPPEADPRYREAISQIARSRDGHEIMAASTCVGVPPHEMVTLDYGMGWALWARSALGLGCRSYGTELSAARVDFARQHGVKVLPDDEIQGHRFHFINTEQVFEHVSDPGALAQRLANALAPGGILKISVPSAERADKIIAALKAGRLMDRDLVMPVQPLEHINSFTIRSVDVLAETVGLAVFWPSLLKRYAFVGRLSNLPRSAKSLVREMIRPVYQFHNRRNLYRWLRKPAAEESGRSA